MKQSLEQMWPFVGRLGELEAMEAAFDRVAGGAGPQAIVLTADSGVGKTRLLVEFYARLGRRYADDGYWPLRLPNDGVTMALNPTPDQFQWPENRKEPAPFMWWGIRCASRGGPNSFWSDGASLNTAASALLPHLCFLEYARAVSADRKGAVDLLSDTLIEIAGLAIDGGVPGLGLAKAAYMKSRENKKRREEIRQIKAATNDIRTASAWQASQLDEQLINGLKAFFSLKEPSGQLQRLRPLVVCVDDAHSLDPISARFVSALLESARVEQWPLLMLFTAPPQDWRSALDGPDQPGRKGLKASLQSLRQEGRAVDTPLAASDQVFRIVQAVYPGLTGLQRKIIADKVGADLYALRELLRTLAENTRRFSNRDTSRELDEAGEAWLHGLKRGRQDIVRYRFRQLLPEVQEFLALCALMGSRVPIKLASDIVRALRAQRWPELSMHAAPELLRRAMEDHFILVHSSANVVDFADEAMADAAREHISASPGDVEAVRQQTRLQVARWIEHSRFEALSWPEISTFLDVATWSVAPDQAQESTDQSTRQQIALAIKTMREIMGSTVGDSVRSLAGSLTNGLEVAQESFRATLAPRWQAKWLYRHATELGFGSRFLNPTPLELRDAALFNVIRATDAVKLQPNWDNVEALSLSATAAVCLSWTTFNQARINRELISADVFRPTREGLQVARARISGTDAMASTLRLCLLEQQSEAEEERERTVACVPMLADALSVHANAGFLTEQSARILFPEVLAKAFFHWPGTSASGESASAAVDAIARAFSGSTITDLGSFQLAAYALSLRDSSILTGTLLDRYQRINDINLMLIRRDMASIVADWTWGGSLLVLIAAGALDNNPAAVLDAEACIDDAWGAAEDILHALCAEEAHINERQFIDLVVSTLKPLASLLLSQETESLSAFSAYIHRIASLSRGSRTTLAVAAARAWMMQAQTNLSQFSVSEAAPARFNLALNICAAGTLFPGKYQSLCGDWQRNLKVVLLVAAELDRIPATELRDQRLASCLKLISKYVDLFADAYRGEAIKQSLHLVQSIALHLQERSTALDALLTEIAEVYKRLDETRGKWRTDSLEPLGRLIAKHAANTCGE